MKPSPPSQPNPGSVANAKLWFQAACLFAAAVVFGVIYNGASPLGVRPNGPSVADAGSFTDAKSAIPRKGVFNETVSMTLESAPGNAPLPAGIHPAPLPPGVPQVAIPTLTWPQVQALSGAKKVVLVDARAKAAYDLGHIPGAVLLASGAPLEEVRAFAAKYPKDTALVVYCGSTTCRASQHLARQLVAVGGFTNVSEMPGGFAEYTVAQASVPKTKP
jgi:rhodanese-related sulfurtransferase